MTKAPKWAFCMGWAAVKPIASNEKPSRVMRYSVRISPFASTYSTG